MKRELKGVEAHEHRLGKDIIARPIPMKRELKAA